MSKAIAVSVVVSAVIAFFLGWTLAKITGKQSIIPVAETFDSAHQEVVETVAKSSLNQDILIEKLSATSNSTAQIEALRQSNQKLKQNLEEYRQQSNEKYQQLQRKHSEAQRILSENGFQQETVSSEEAKATLPAPFADLVSGASGSMAEKFKELQSLETDFDWGSQMQLQISDFFITHELTNLVALQSVTCKQTICELRGFQFEDKAFGRILNDARKEVWWTFKSSHSSSANNNEFGLYFYALVY